MSLVRALALSLVAVMLLLPNDPEPVSPTGGMHWICLAYGGLAGAALMSGSVVGALGAYLGASRAGCFR